MALKDLIATQGEAEAARIIEKYRFSGDAKAEIFEAVKAAVDSSIAHEREACAGVAAFYKSDDFAALNAAAEIALAIRGRSIS